MLTVQRVILYVHQRSMRIAFSICLIVSGKLAKACLILVLSDGNEVLVANHEDWFATNSAVRFIPASDHRYASIVFTFEDEGWAQGGMNEHGLFFDGAFTPNPALDFTTGQKVDYNGYIWQAVLDRCKSVDEALDFIQKYKLPDLDYAHVVLADSTGHAAVLGVANGSVAIHESNREIVQTNFNRWHPEMSEDLTCSRYEKTLQIIHEKEVSKELMLEVLANTHQDSLTVYSNIYDLRNKEILVFQDRDFENPIPISFHAMQDKDCLIPLSTLTKLQDGVIDCEPSEVQISGKVVDEAGIPIPYANIGIKASHIGTISDPDGSFFLDVPVLRTRDTITFSSIGFRPHQLLIGKDKEDLQIVLRQQAVLLEEVEVSARKSFKKTRVGYMKGSDGMLPLDSLQGGAAVATLLSAPRAGFYIDKLQFRLLYNSKDTSNFRLHVYSFDSQCQCPGEELLNDEVFLKGTRKFGWERFDLTDRDIFIAQKQFFVALEWLDDRSLRMEMMKGLRNWEQWKRSQYEKGDTKVEQVRSNHPGGEEWVYYKYHGNMMQWPGWKELPPFTGLMVETGKNEKTLPYRTFERKTSFSPWIEKNVTLNIVLQIAY